MKYLVAHTDDARRLGLSGAEAWVYCALCCLTRKQPFNGSMTKLAEESMCGDKSTACRVVAKLIEKGIVVRGDNGALSLQNATPPLQNATLSLQNATNSKRKVPKENNNIIKENVVVNNRPQAADNNNDNNNTFSLFWNNYSASGENWNNEKGGTKAFFDKLTDIDQQKAIQRASTHRKGKNPYFFLFNRDFDNAPEVQKELRILSGQEADMAKAMGARVVVARTPDGKYKTVLAQDAEAFSLHILREF